MFCDLGNVSVYYETHGEGFPIVMIHGFTPDHRLMTGCLEPVFENQPGWRRIYLDLPGMGQTKGEEWIKGSDHMLEVVERFIEKMIPEGRYLLAGESYGGYLIRAIAARQPERVAGMLFICPLVEPIAAKRILPMPAVIAQDKEFVASLTPEQQSRFTPLSVVQDRYNWERFEKEILPGLQIADPDFLQKISKRYEFSFEWGEPVPFDKPVLFLTGRQDHVTGYQDVWAILEQYPRASIAVLDRAGHNLQTEQSGLFTALVDEWLKRVMENENLQ
ncbi:alpha/beta fold hydrolase [Brevibacillus choshinensis]|uniref:Alpha/beta hydrolase n=1 Tax=Brevibacillus choshinensis TaxID=54911 RepID=A0ABX7FG33_BRECH|nr:alpha/beta hydrolase [Brevibacillus choshinensis]QRG65087.1 alpha/beta hydrolase [Brevibacillus choshinensis]